MANTSYYDLYKALKADGAVQGDWNSFHSFVGAQGKKGYENRKKLYDALKADGAVQAKTYEEFNMNLFRGGQASLRAAKQRRQQQAQRNAQPSARNTAAQQVDSGVPMTAAQRALQMSAGAPESEQTQPQQVDYLSRPQSQMPQYGKAPKGKISPFVRALYSDDDARRGSVERPYTMPTGKKEDSSFVQNMKQRQQRQRQFMGGAATVDGQLADYEQQRNQPIVDTGIPDANQSIVKTQGQLMDEMNASAQNMVSNSGEYMKNLLDEAFSAKESAGEDVIKDYLGDTSDSWFTKGLAASAGKSNQAFALRGYNEAIDPSSIQKRLGIMVDATLQNIVGDPEFGNKVQAEADRLGVSPEAYAQYALGPQLMEKISDEFEKRQLDKYMPRNTLQRMLNNYVNSNVVMKIATLGTSTKGGRRYAEQAEAMTAEGKNPYYKPGVIGTIGNVAAQVAGMVTDPAFKVGSKAGSAVVSKIFGGGSALASKIANGSLAQKIGYIAGSGAVGGGVTGLTFGIFNNAVNNLSTGEDTSLWGTLQSVGKGAIGEAASFATMGVAGTPVGLLGRSVGTKAAEDVFSREWIKGASAKVGLVTAKTFTEAFGMNLGGYVSGRLEGATGKDGKPITFDAWNGTLKELPMAIGFAFTHMKGQKYKDKNGKPLGFWANAMINFSNFAISDKAKGANMVFSKDEKQEIFDAGGRHGLMPNGENIVSFAERSRKHLKDNEPTSGADVESDVEMMKSYYDRIIADPNVSWDAKAKFTTMVMGIIPASRPLHSYFAFGNDNAGKNNGKYVYSYANDGTLLSKIRYDTSEDRKNIIYKMSVARENQILRNAWALGVGYVSDNREMQAQFLLDIGYKNADRYEQEKMLNSLADKNSDLYHSFLKWCANRDDSPIGRAVSMINSATGMSKDAIIRAFEKDPMKRSDAEQNICVALRRALTSELFPESKPHPEQSAEDGKDVVADNNLGTEQPNGEAVVTELRTLKQAEEEMAQLMNSNDVFSENFNDLQKKGLTHPQIYDWMIQNGLTEDDLLPYAKYMNQVARVQGMQDATAKAIEENVGAFVQDWTFHGTMDGQEVNGENALWVKDKDGRTLLVGSGDVAYDPTTGRAKEGVGDMLVCLDPNTGEMVYVRAEDTTLFDNKPASDLEAFRRQQLQEINSAPYNQAAQEQAAADAAKPQQEGAAEPENKVGQPQTAEIGSEPIVNSIVNDGKGGTDNMGNTLNSDGSIHTEKVNTLDEIKDDEFDEPTRSVELPEIPDNVATAIGSNGKPIIIKKNIFKKNATNHPELDASDSRAILNEALYNPNLVGQTQPVKRPSYKVAIKTGDKNSIVVLDVYDDKKQVEIVGWRRINEKGLAKMQRQAEREGGQFLILSPNDGSAAALSALPHDLSSVGKDTNNSSNGNGVNTTLTFKDGSAVPVDANGEPDFMNMTPEQGAEVYKTLFPKTYEAEVDSAIKMLDKDLKNAQKATPKSKGVMARAKEQADIEAAINLAEEQLAKAQAIKKALTAEKVAETMAKPEGEKPTEEANKASGAAAEKFQNAPRLVGNKRTRTLPNNEKVKGHYEIVPAESLTPSHDAMNGYKKSDGFPVDSEGRTINDRDYENDKSAQQNTDQIALKYNGQAIEQVPVVSDEGIVYDGNGRTMAGQKAAKDGTDAEYINDLMDNAENFGFTREQIEQSGIEHPRLVMVTDERMPYTADTFAKFNRNEKKTQSNTEQAVAKAKTLSADEVGAIVAEIEGNGSLEAFFNNPNAINSLIKTLVSKDIIGQNEVAELMEGNDRLSPQGKEMVKNILLGSIFKPETIRMLGVDSAIKNKAVAAIRSVMDNLKLGDYSLRDEIDSAIQLLYEARRGDNKVDTLLRTPEFFGESAADRYPSISQMMALALEGKVSDFRDLINEYNREAAARNTGEGDMFGDTPTKEELIRDFLKYKKWKDYETRGNQEAERGNDAEGVRKTEPEAQGGNGEKQAESQREVDEAIKSIATEITKQTGVTVHTDEKKSQQALEDAEATDSDIKYHKETDEEVLNELNSGKTIKVYRAMQVIDGKLYPPMAASVGGKLVEANELGTWIRADENPDLAIPDIDPKTGKQKVDPKTGELKWKFKLDKGGKDATGKKATAVNAAYNPYWHLSRSPLNDQFKSAWIRPNIVVVECEVPESELTSGYKAERAKDAVGEVDWKSGSVSGEVFKQTGRARKVILSRWCKPVRVLDDAEVAQRAKEFVGEADVTIPENVLTPKQRVAFEEAGFKIGAPEKGVKKSEQIAEALEAGLMVDNTVREFRGKNGEVYGFVTNGEIHLDTKNMKPDTPLHEYTHLWTSALQKANPKEWENVKSLLDSVEGLKEEVQKLYPELKGDDLYDEMLATYSGREGTKKLEEAATNIAKEEGKTLSESAKAKSFISKVKEALQKYWNGVADMLHIKFTSAEEVADKVLADWAKGVDPTFMPKEPKPSNPIEKAAEDYKKEHPLTEDEVSSTTAFDDLPADQKQYCIDAALDYLHGEDTSAIAEAYYRNIYEKRSGNTKPAAKEKKEVSANPMEKMQEAANDYKQEQIDKASEAYKEAKESGDEEQTTKAAKNLKHLMDESYKEKGYSLAKRQSLIAKVVGKKEAEIIDKPLNEMDSEELEFVASKNPLTESEIREQAPDEDRNFIEDAVDYVNGNHGFAQKLAYLKIYKDVRSGHENAASDSGAEDGAQLAPADNGSGEGLGLGTGRESGGPAGQLDRGAGNEPASRERESGESGKNDSAASSGEPSDKQGEGDTSRLGDVPTGGTEPKGGSGTGKDGDVSQRGGRKGSGGSAAKNAKRKPTAKQGTTWRGRSGEEIKKNVEEKKAAALAAIAQLKKLKYGKGGSGYLGSMQLMTSEQIEYLPTVANAIKDYGMAIIDEGIYKIKDWVNRIRETFKDSLMDCGFTESEVDRFIKEMWNSKMEMDGETHTIADWCAIYEGSTLRKKLSEVLDEKRQKQMDAEPIEVKVGDRKNIEETLPYLLPQQQEDVYRAETQFFGKEHADRDHAYGKGYMFTNGTGTGKTYTGLGIIKRLTKQGKGRILIVTPSGQKVKDWSDDGKNLNLNIKSLEDWAKERGTNATSEVGEGCVITTFANFGLNKKLLEVEWDAVIYDESHRIMENKDGKETARSMQHYKVTNRNESHCFSRLQEINPHYQKIQDAADRFAKQREAERKKIVKEYKASHPFAAERDANLAASRMMPKDLNSFAPADGQTFPKLGKIYNEFTEAKNYYYNNVKPKLEKQAKDTWKNTKTVFLSATPFNTRENLDYAEGYIFKYPKEDESGMSGRTRFYLDHFGAAYKFRYHRLEQNISNPDAVAKQEIAFSDYLQHNLGTMSGRIIDSPYDYSRDFPTVAPDHAEAFNDAVQECLNTRYLHGAYSKTIGDYNYGSALFETMKVANTVNRIKEHLAAGRKVVIYHRRVETKEPIRPPFEYMLDEANKRIAEMKPGKERNEFIAEVTAFRNKYQDLLQWEQTLDYSMPREQLAKVFGKDNVLFFSGKEGKKVKENAIKNFNDDDSGKNILVIQEASGKEGISLQDKTGKHQRVVITLALPQSPITALQIEGRIYRIGNMSNAIFEYPILGLNSEMMLFGQKFNNQVSTTENLALGSQARNLRDSFAKGILEHSGIVPIDQQGVGGKAFDAPKQEGESDPFDDAVLDYYSNQKLNKNNRQGVDYFPTPEPLGYKMVQWAGLADGDSVLEPSAGHGAIARYVPKSNELVSIEPNQSLFSRLQLKVGNLGRKFLNNTFENYAISNKHDAIIMNPPFGKAGATAIQHVDKAFRHLDEGGRLVALIPRGSMDKKFEDWIEKNKDAVVRAEVNLPDITFQQAGTGVRTRVVVLDKVSDATMREKAGRTEVTDLSGNYDKVEDFFEDLRNVEMPDRIIDTKAKMMKKSRQGVKDIRDIKGVAYALLDKEEGVTVRIKGDWRHNYHISFQNSDNPDMWKRKMASYYKEYDELGKSLTANETKQAVFDEMKKLTCKLADMTEEEMQRFIKNADGSNTTHFREERGVQYSKTDVKDVKNSRIIPEDVDKSVSSQIEKKFDEDIEHILSSCPQSLRSRYERLIDANIRLYGLISTKKISNEVNSYEALYKQATGGTGKSSEVGNGDSSNDAFYRTQYLLARAAANRELDYRADRRKNLESLFGLKSGERLTYENVDRVFEQSEGAKDEGIRALYEKAKAINNRLGTDIEGEFVDEEGTDFLGDSSTGRRISLFIDALTRTRTGGNELGITLVHEMLHQATTGAIHLVKSGKADGVLTPKQVEGVKEILKLYDEVKGDKERFKEKDYGLQSVYEFVAQMADPRQRKALSRLGAAKSELGKKENNILKRFVNAIKKLFQITSDKSKMDSAINKIMDDFNKNSDDFAMNDIEQNDFAYKVTDKDELDRLNKEKTFRMYSGMQELDGKLYSPMAAIIDGKRTDATEIGAWMRSDERPDLVKGGKFTLVKTDKSKGAGEGDVDAAYNPYMHTSTSMMNDQFTGAYARGNIKVVEWDIPESEKTSGYHAEGAKNSVGLVPWHSGSVNGLLPKDRQRSVMLSRWRKAVRVVPDSEVAESIANQLKGTGLAIPWNVVTPNQLRELAKLGVPITTKESGTQSPDVKAKFNAQMEDLKKEFPQAKFVDVKMTKDAHKEWGKNGGTHFREDRSSEDLYNSLNDKQNNKKEYNGTVTELANRVKQGTARIVREGEGAESSGSVNRRESLPAIAGKILNAANKQGDGQSTGLAGEASDRKGEKVLHLAQVYGQIEQWAKENGCYFTEDDIAKNSLDGKVWNDEGVEATIYRSKDGKSVIKVMSIDNYYNNAIDYYLDRNNHFNEVFPDTAIEVVGYGRDSEGRPSIIYKQPLVEGKTVYDYFNGDDIKANEYIDNMLAEMGYDKKVAHDDFGLEADSNGKYNLFDVNYRNVIIDKDGKPHVIDAEVLPVDYKNDGKVEIKDTDSSHFRNDESAVSIADDAPLVVKHVDKIAKQVGGKVKMVASPEEVTNKEARERIERGENVTGWYDEKTGEVHLYMPNIHDRYTAEKTIWHEVVGHKGMRELIGEENYSNFLRSLWYDLDQPENARLKELVSEELKYNPLDFENGIEEGIARLVEDGKGEPGFWNNIKNKVTDLLHEIGYRVAPNTKDVKYLLWLAKNMQKHPNDLTWKMRAEAVRYKLSKENVPAIIDKDGYIVNNDGKEYNTPFDLGRRNFEEATDGRIHFRTTLSTASKIDRYNRILGTKMYAFKESTVDDMQSVQEFMEIVSGKKNVWESIPSSMNPLQAHNRIGEMIRQRAEKYEREFIAPLDEVFKKAVSLMDGKDGLDQKKNFELYAIQKHGLERNRVLFVRDYITGLEKDDADILSKQWDAEKKDLDDRLRDGTINLKDYYEEMDEWIRNNVDGTFVADEHDYSGFHAIQNIGKQSSPYNDKMAIDNVMNAEDKMGADLVKDFWEKKKAATDWIVDNEYTFGMADNSQREHLKNMFNWYLPLRKFDETTAEDVYGYINNGGDPSNYIGSVIANAKGRTSLSDTNVLAQISAMANASLVNGGNNYVKQHLARFVSNYETGRHKDRIFLEINPWVEKRTVDGKEVWEEVTPQIPENATQEQISDILRDFEDGMKAKESKGEAKLYNRRRQAGYRFVRAKDKSQHLVEVYIAGKRRLFFCQANPRAAQAINGLLKDSGTQNRVAEMSSKINRLCAQLNTSYNPDFIESNMMRDLTAASANVVTKEGIGYAKDFMKEYRNNFLSFWHGTGDGNYWTMFKKYRNGTLNMSNDKERLFKEFIENGGQTGFVQMQKLDELVKSYDNFIKTGNKDVSGWLMRQIKDKGGFIKAANEIIENMARFSTYTVSRSRGRSVGLSIYNAKEVSVNFNRHGSGDAIKTLKTANDSAFDTKFRSSLGWFNSVMKNHTMFYNAGVQGANLFFKNYKAAWLPAATAFGALPFGLNIAMALINQYFINQEDEKERNGTKDPYAELPEWKRRNNLCLYVGKGRFATVPMAIELRAFYGLGDIAMSLWNPRLKSATPFGYDVLGQMAQLVPASDFLGHHSSSDSVKSVLKDIGLAVTPTVLKPEMELIANRDWTGRPIYRDADYLDNAPQWKSSYDSTNDAYMAINKRANMMTNGLDNSNPDLKGNDALDYGTAPYTWQHLIDGYFGGLGATIGRASKSTFALGKSIKEGVTSKDGFSKGFSNEWSKLDKNQIPFWRVFVYKPSEGHDMQRTKSKWYNYKDELEKIDYNIKQLKVNTPDSVQNIKNAAKLNNFYDTNEGKQILIYQATNKDISRLKGFLKKTSDPDSIKSINENIDRKMQEAVDDLDKLN